MRKYIALLVILGLIEISLVLYLAIWREIFWNFVSVKNLEGFIKYLGIFTGVALVLCFATATSTYVRVKLAVVWRKKLNAKALTLKHIDIENVSQRIQEDCMTYPDYLIYVIYGITRAVLFFVVFSIALSIQFNVIYLICIVTFGIGATLLAKKIGYPLIGTYYKSQKVEATYRTTLTELDFMECIKLQLRLAAQEKKLKYFQGFFGQLGVIVPLIIVAPVYFTTQMLLGSLMQATSMMGTITEHLSYGVDNFATFNHLISARKRLLELGVL